jgi:ABC-type branched-subunit amino acid transport system permease subunit
MVRARLELGLGALFALGAVATAIWPTWLESLTGLEPDAGTGEAEWWLVVLLGVAAVVAGLLGRRDLRATRSQPSGGVDG